MLQKIVNEELVCVRIVLHFRSSTSKSVLRLMDVMALAFGGNLIDLTVTAIQRQVLQ